MKLLNGRIPTWLVLVVLAVVVIAVVSDSHHFGELMLLLFLAARWLGYIAIGIAGLALILYGCAIALIWLIARLHAALANTRSGSTPNATP